MNLDSSRFLRQLGILLSRRQNHIVPVVVIEIDQRRAVGEFELNPAVVAVAGHLNRECRYADRFVATFSFNAERQRRAVLVGLASINRRPTVSALRSRVGVRGTGLRICIRIGIRIRVCVLIRARHRFTCVKGKRQQSREHEHECV